MKKVSIIVCILLCASISFADIIEKTYYFETPDIKSDGEYAILEIEDSYHLGNPGEPSIPYRGVSLLLPQNHEITHLSVALYDCVDMGHYTVFPVQQPTPLSKMDQATFTPPDETIYTIDVAFPASQHTEPMTHLLSGYSIGSFAFTPFSYIPMTGELSYYRKAVVTIETSYSNVASQSQKFLHRNPHIEKRLASLIDNYEMIDTYSVPEAKTDGYDYIIITSSEFEDDYQVLADFHAMRGLRTTITLVGDITDNYPGVDTADQIRNYIIAEYADYPVRYVLLGGDTEIIPDRGMSVHPGPGNDDDDIPADMYYGCLDRTTASGDGPDWNNNNNSLWGEDDEADLLAEVYIGRICANNSEEITNQINKIQRYLEEPIADELETTLMVGEYLWEHTYGGSYLNKLLVGCSTGGYTTVGIPGTWDVTKLYEMDYDWTSNDLYDALNQGPNLLNHLGHGTTTHCLNIDNSNLTEENLTNDGIVHNFYNGYSQACYSGSLDNRTYSGTTGQDCFMKVITNMSTGAASFVGNSRYGWNSQGGTDGPSQHFHREYLDVLFDTGVYSVGGANQLSKEKSVSYINDNYVRWCYYELNVFGDPALDLWTAEPTTCDPTYPQFITGNEPGIDITVPEGARAVVYDDSTIYGYAEGSGTLFFDTVPSEPGIIHIAVVAHNYYTYIGDIIVTASIVHITPETIDVNVPTHITVYITEQDSITPRIGVNVWAEGIGYTSETELTDETGTATLDIDYPYGPTLHIFGFDCEEDYYVLQETVNVAALDLSNPNLGVTTTIGFVDTFALNLEGTIEAQADDNDICLWVNVDDSGFVLAADLIHGVTPSILMPVEAVIAKSGYNIYGENFPVATVYGEVSGTVTESQNNTPVADAEISFYKQGATPIIGDPVFAVTTDASGAYISPQEYAVDYYDVYVTKWGYNLYVEQNYFLGYGSNTHDIVLDPAGTSIVTGYVKDDAMITGAILTYCRSDNGETYTSVQTDGGTYEVDLPNFTYTVYVTADGHVPYQGTCIVDGNQEYHYHLGFAEIFDGAENGLGNWTTSSWGTTEEEYVSPTHSFTDSPGGSYPAGRTTYLKLTEPFSLSAYSGEAYLYFNAKWDIEEDYDYAQVQASIDGSAWIALKGDYTHDGSGSSQPAEPLYDGEQLEWVEEASNLSEFAGESQVYIRFCMKSDNYVHKDGIYIDDVFIGDTSSSYEIPIVSNDNPPVINMLTLNQNFPNPVIHSTTTISFSLPPHTQNAELTIYNIKGQLVKTFVPETSADGSLINFVWDGADNNNKSVANGVYFYRLEAGNQQQIKKMIIMK